VDPDFWQMDPVGVADFLERECSWNGAVLSNRRTGRRVKAILPVHILGHPVDLDPIIAVAQKFGLQVIEDATEGLGSRYRGRSIGGIGDAGCFSFNGNKIITTGGGGMFVTNNEKWAIRAKYLTTQAKDDPLEYIHGEVGYNYRLTNILAAMGCAQMERLDSFIEAKRTIADRYRDALTVAPGIRLPETASWAFSTFWMFTILLDENVCPIDARALLHILAKSQIQSRPLWQPLHRSPAHDPTGSPPSPVADTLYRQAISLPCSVGLTQAAQTTVTNAVAAALLQQKASLG
jgi:perosamine synthetase